MYLLVRQRRDGDEAELGYEPLVEPVKVLVPSGYLDIVELKIKFLRIRITIPKMIIDSQGIFNDLYIVVDLELLVSDPEPVPHV